MRDDIEAVTLRSDDGLALEAELARPVGPARAAVALAHPHPLRGGSMRSLVTSELFGALPGRGLIVLRFNFRGVGASEGSHGGGIEERRDVVAALDALAPLAGTRPLVLAGWSFGADVSLTVTDERLAGWFPVAPPLRTPSPDAYGAAAADPRPKCFTVPERDHFRPPDGVREATAGWVNTAIHVVPGADHFLVGRTVEAVELLDAFAGTLPAGGAAG